MCNHTVNATTPYAVVMVTTPLRLSCKQMIYDEYFTWRACQWALKGTDIHCGAHYNGTEGRAKKFTKKSRCLESFSENADFTESIKSECVMIIPSLKWDYEGTWQCDLGYLTPKNQRMTCKATVEVQV